MIRVLVVEDSLTVRQRLLEILAKDPELVVVGQAADGERAIELCRTLRPDVITLDMILPGINGVSATEHVMAHFPTPILIVSSSTNRGELLQTYDALAAGAVDVLEKPRGDETDAGWEMRFLAAVKLVSRIKVISHPRARLGRLGRVAPAREPMASAESRGDSRVVALGASTGGPGALVDVLRGIPVSPHVAILVVLHIDEPFGQAFAEWLGDQTPHRVVTAADGDSLETARGKAVLAPPGRHLVIESGKLRLTSSPERHSCRPSIDVLFESLAAESGPLTTACLLTGMGRDGAAGLLAIRRAGGFTIAQDEETSIVFGMPREAALLGAAERVLPLDQIGHAVAASLLEPRERS